MKINMILLAAGNSRRFGSNKLLYEVAGQTLFEHAFEKALAIKSQGFIEQIIVVTQYHQLSVLAANAVAKVLPEMEKGDSTGDFLTICYNDKPKEGISRSLRLGIEASNEDTEAYLFFVCDQPFIKVASMTGLLAGYVKSQQQIGCIRQGQRTGNPVIFSRAFRDELLALTGDTGGKAVLKRHPEQVYYFDIDGEAELEDMDYCPDITNGYDSDSNLV